jgi:hypothetical protein
MPANHDFWGRRAAAESDPLQRGKVPAGTMAKTVTAGPTARVCYSSKAALISGIHFPVKPSSA